MKTLVEAGERTDGMIEKEKTPSGEIEKALKIKEAYYGDKQSSSR
ncbi:hypothetical protein [Bacteroides sp.]